jgi:hypothetical protein
MLAEAAIRRLRSLQKHLVEFGSLTAALQETTLDAMGSRKETPRNVGSTSTAKRPRVDRFGENNDTEILICSVARTPLGSFQGSLWHLSATDLGSIAIKAAVERANLPVEAVQEIFMGNVCSANLGQAPARQAALKAGLPQSADATTINKVCSSGLKAIALGAQSIALGLNNIVVAGGMESMSNIPYYDIAARKGARLGHATLVDGMLNDGLWDATYQIHMGDCAGKNKTNFFSSSFSLPPLHLLINLFILLTYRIPLSPLVQNYVLKNTVLHVTHRMRTQLKAWLEHRKRQLTAPLLGK